MPFVWLKVATVATDFVASTVIDNAAEVDALPAESVSVTVKDQTPSASVPRVHEVDEIVQETLEEPLVAVTTAVPEEVETLIVGVLSEVMLSVSDIPALSEAVARSGVEGVATVDLLITSPVSAVEALEVMLLKVWVAVTEYVPLANVVNGQDPVAPVAVKVHTTAVPEDGVAVKVMTAPTAKPDSEISGVSSFVVLSVLEEPRSEEDTKSGVPVAANVTVTESVETNDKFPAASTA
jgi:hypothetical protein